jgi:hypothetical protein
MQPLIIRDIRKHKMKNKLFTFLIILTPILNIYSSGIHENLHFGTLLISILLVFLTLNIIKMKLVLKPNKLIYYLIYSIIITLLAVITISDKSINFFILIIILQLVIVLVFVPIYFDIVYCEKIFFWVSILAFLFLIYQILLFKIFQIVIPPVLEFFPLTSGIDNLDFISTHRLFMNTSFRPSSFFMEPSHYSIFIGSYIAMSLGLKTRNIAISIILSVSVLFTSSANGYAFIFSIWIVWFFVKVIKFLHVQKIKKRILNFVFILFFIVLFVVFYNENILYNFNRIFEAIFIRSDFSDNLRIFRGFNIFNDLKFVYKLFGIGYGDIAVLLKSMNISDIFNTIEIYDYMSTISRILISTGVVGSLIFLYPFIKAFKEDKEKRYLILILFIIFVSSSITFNGYFTLILAIIFSKSYKRLTDSVKVKSF